MMSEKCVPPLVRSQTTGRGLRCKGNQNIVLNDRCFFKKSKNKQNKPPKTAGAKRPCRPFSFFFLEAGGNIAIPQPHCRRKTCSPCRQESDGYHRGHKVENGRILYTQTLLNTILVLLSLPTQHSSFSTVASLCSTQWKSIQALPLLWAFLHFLRRAPCVMCKLGDINVYASPCESVSCPFNSQDQLSTLRG